MAGLKKKQPLKRSSKNLYLCPKIQSHELES